MLHVAYCNSTTIGECVFFFCFFSRHCFIRGRCDVRHEWREATGEITTMNLHRLKERLWSRVVYTAAVSGMHVNVARGWRRSRKNALGLDHARSDKNSLPVKRSTRVSAVFSILQRFNCLAEARIPVSSLRWNIRQQKCEKIREKTKTCVRSNLAKTSWRYLCHFLFNITGYRKLPGMSRSLLWYDPTRMVAWEMPLGLDARFFFSFSSSVLPRQHAVNRHFYHILECRARINTRDGEAKND